MSNLKKNEGASGKRNVRMNLRQRERFLDLVETYGDELYGSKGNVVKNQTWRHIVYILNKLGPEKSTDQWKKSLAGLKLTVKKQAIQLKLINNTCRTNFQSSEEDCQLQKDISAITGDASFSGRINSMQRSRLLELIEDNIFILCSRNTEETMEKWSIISEKLNGLGHEKNSNQWREIWSDIKNGVKKKMDQLKAVGGSKQLGDGFTNEDIQVIRILIADKDPVGENEQTPKTPPIEIESSDDDDDDDKVDRLRADQKQSLKNAVHSHLQGLTLNKSVIKYNVSRTATQAKTKNTAMIGSSDEDDEETTQTDLLHIRKHIRTQSNPLDLPDIKFKQFFKMSKDVFVHILEEIKDKLPEATCSSSVPAILKLAATLRFLVKGRYQSVSDEYKLGLAQPTVSKVLTDMLIIIEKHICPKWIKFEYTEQEIQQAELYFYQQAGIPGVIGCVDTTFIKILAPTKDQHKYRNREGTFSLHTMIVCDHRMTIRFIDASNPGSVHKSIIWNSSDLRGVLRKSFKSTWLLGDADFPLEPFLITPYTSVEEGGKEIMAKTIRVLKSRFQCLLGERPLHYTPQKSKQIINVCSAIHNICLRFKSDLPIEQNVVDDESTADPDSDKQAEQIRNRILNAI